MVKKVKIENLKSSLNRDVIAKFGNSVYNLDEIIFVSINVKFRDGSIIGYKRSEENDTMENFIEDDENE